MYDVETKLSYRVFWSEEDQEFVGICEQFGPHLSHLDETPEAALTGIQKLVLSCIEDLNERGAPMPWEVKP